MGGSIVATANKGPLAGEVKSPDAIGYLNLLIYGHPGAGKTYLAGTAMDHAMTTPVLVLDVEGGTVTLRSRKDIDVIQVRSPEHVKEIHDKLREDNDGYYKTVVIDSLTELQKLDMRAIMEKAHRDNPRQDIDVPSQREWGKSNEHIRRIVRAFRDLEMNTIFTALMIEVKDDKTGQVTYYPSVPGKLKAEVPGFLDIVGYLHTAISGEEVKRTIQFAQSQRVIAKDRTDSLGSMMDNPTIPDMWTLIHQNDKKASK